MIGLLIKGRSYKTTRQESYEEPLPSGGRKLTTLNTEVVVTDITTVDENGEIQSHNGPGLEQFLSQWIGQLTHIVASDYPPVYQFNMNGYGPLMGNLSKKRPSALESRRVVMPAAPSQEQALYLVAAKVAAAQRVNGDTVSDDSLAELDSITGSDIVATLARIVAGLSPVGDAEVHTQSLQQAFAEANASLRQANTVIGEYEMVDDEPEPEILTRDEAQSPIDVTLTPQADPQQTLASRMALVSPVEPLDTFEWVQQAQIVDEPPSVAQQQALFLGNGHSVNGRAANGKSSTIPITENGRHNDCHKSQPQPNGNGHSYRNGDKPEHEAEDKRPPVPRPRLLIGEFLV